MSARIPTALADASPQTAVPFGKYTLLKRLAVGGMAELFLAVDNDAKRPVVIKRILPYLSDEAEFVQMFLDEARIAAQLHHENIVQVHELGNRSGSIFIAMEHVDGADLRRVLQEEARRGEQVPLGVAAFVAAQLCAGLYHAHNAGGVDGKVMGIIHRDVSPQNVMVGFDGRVKLVDFGIAKAGALMEHSKPGIIKGKFLYLSPEQVAQQRIDHRADLFALGTLLYEITCGKSPFARATTEGIIYAIREEEPAAPASLRPGYPPELARIVLKCLQKDRSRRYQDADQLRRDLDAFLRATAPTTPAQLSGYVSALFGQEDESTVLNIPGLHLPNGELPPTSRERSPTPAPPAPSPRVTPRPLVPEPEGPTLTSGGAGSQSNSSTPDAASAKPLAALEPPPERRASGMRYPGAGEGSSLSAQTSEATSPTADLRPHAPQSSTEDPRPHLAKPSEEPQPDRGEEPATAPERRHKRRSKGALVATGTAPVTRSWQGALRDGLGRVKGSRLVLAAVLGGLLLAAVALIVGLWPRRPAPLPPIALRQPRAAPVEEVRAAEEAPRTEEQPASATPAPVEDAAKAKVQVVFKAPSRTVISLGAEKLTPGKVYAFSPGTVVLQYRCPNRRSALNHTARIQSRKGKDPQLLTLKCR